MALSVASNPALPLTRQPAEAGKSPVASSAAPSAAQAAGPAQAAAPATLEQRIQLVLNEYRPTLYKDGGDVEVLKVDDQGVAHIKMLGACIDCPISILTMKLGIQRLLKEHFAEITGVNAITDVSIADLYKRPAIPG